MLGRDVVLNAVLARDLCVTRALHSLNLQLAHACARRGARAQARPTNLCTNNALCAESSRHVESTCTRYDFYGEREYENKLLAPRLGLEHHCVKNSKETRVHLLTIAPPQPCVLAARGAARFPLNPTSPRPVSSPPHPPNPPPLPPPPRLSPKRPPHLASPRSDQSRGRTHSRSWCQSSRGWTCPRGCRA